MEIFLAAAGAVTHGYVLRYGQRLILASLKIIKLCPGINVDEILKGTLNVFHRDIFVMLGRIRAQLKPEQVAA